MRDTLELKMDNGEFIYIEVKENYETENLRSFGKEQNLTLSATKLNDSLMSLKVFSKQVIDNVKNSVEAPNELTIAFGLKFSAKVGIIITSIDSEASLQITMKWNNIK